MSPMLFFMEFVDIALEVCNMWRYEKVGGYMKKQLFGSFLKKYDTFCALIRVVIQVLRKNYTWRESIPIEIQIAMALARLGNGDHLPIV